VNLANCVPYHLFYILQEIAFFDNHDNSTGALATRLSTDASAMQGVSNNSNRLEKTGSAQR